MWPGRREARSMCLWHSTSSSEERSADCGTGAKAGGACGRRGKICVLQGEKVRLRPVQDEDIPKLVEWDNDKNIVRWAGKKFENREDAKEWHLKSTLQRRTYAIELLSGRLIGEIEVLNISWRLKTGEMRVYIGEKDLWDQGLGEDAVRTLTAGFFNLTALEELFLRVDEENFRARRCYEKAGFRVEGRLRHEREDGCPRTLLLMRLRKSGAAPHGT